MLNHLLSDLFQRQVDFLLDGLLDGPLKDANNPELCWHFGSEHLKMETPFEEVSHESVTSLLEHFLVSNVQQTKGVRHVFNAQVECRVVLTHERHTVP